MLFHSLPKILNSDLTLIWSKKNLILHKASSLYLFDVYGNPTGMEGLVIYLKIRFNLFSIVSVLSRSNLSSTFEATSGCFDLLVDDSASFRQDDQLKVVLSKVGHLARACQIKVLFTHLGCYYFIFYYKNLRYHITSFHCNRTRLFEISSAFPTYLEWN